MKIQTKYFGQQEIDDARIIHFPAGLPGFAEARQFYLQPFGEAFYVLQSVSDAAVAFIVTSPFYFFEKYGVDLPDALVSKLEIESEKDVSVWAIVSVRNPFTKSTVNLKAPVIINTTKKLGKQYIPDHSPYSLSEPFIQPEKGKGA
jgi:Uncharacterized protein conserved in bacteria